VRCRCATPDWVRAWISHVTRPARLALRCGRLLVGLDSLTLLAGCAAGAALKSSVPPVVRNVRLGSTILSDGYRGYTGEHGVIASGYVHLPRTQESFRLAGTEDVVPHAHRAISNLKAWLLGTHRGVGADHLQVYLDEYVFRWNRRRSPMAGFQTLLGLGTGREPSTYLEILGPQPAAGTPRRPGRKTGITRVAPPLAG